jgi:hypothetical protein
MFLIFIELILGLGGALILGLSTGNLFVPLGVFLMLWGYGIQIYDKIQRDKEK